MSAQDPGPGPFRRRRVAPRRTGSSLPALVATLGLVSVLVACGGTGPDVAEDEVKASQRTSDYLIEVDALPPGWRDSNAQGIDYRVTVCGIDLEPLEPQQATSVRFSEGPVGPFLEQHVRIYDTDVVADVVAELRDALAGCTSYEAQGSSLTSPTARFSVEPLTVEGLTDSGVAWRQTSEGDLPVTSDIVLLDRGPVSVLLMSYVVRGTPDPEVLRQAVAAVPQAVD